MLPKVNSKRAITVFPICTYLELWVPLPTVRLAYVGVHGVQAPPSPLVKFARVTFLLAGVPAGSLTVTTKSSVVGAVSSVSPVILRSAV